jgi:hypothetical protein
MYTQAAGSYEDKSSTSALGKVLKAASRKKEPGHNNRKHAEEGDSSEEEEDSRTATFKPKAKAVASGTGPKKSGPPVPTFVEGGASSVKAGGVSGGGKSSDSKTNSNSNSNSNSKAKAGSSNGTSGPEGVVAPRPPVEGESGGGDAAGEGSGRKRKRTKTRSRQKNIRKDNRLDIDKPKYLPVNNRTKEIKGMVQKVAATVRQ